MSLSAVTTISLFLNWTKCMHLKLDIGLILNWQSGFCPYKVALFSATCRISSMLAFGVIA
jgi:hypothetical protein